MPLDGGEMRPVDSNMHNANSRSSRALHLLRTVAALLNVASSALGVWARCGETLCRVRITERRYAIGLLEGAEAKPHYTGTGELTLRVSTTWRICIWYTVRHCAGCLSCLRRAVADIRGMLRNSRWMARGTGAWRGKLATNVHDKDTQKQRWNVVSRNSDDANINIETRLIGINQSVHGPIEDTLWNNNETLGKGHLFSSAADEFHDALPPSWRSQVTAPPNSGGQVLPTHCNPTPLSCPPLMSGHRELPRPGTLCTPSLRGRYIQGPTRYRAPQSVRGRYKRATGRIMQEHIAIPPPSLSRPLLRCGGPSRNITKTVSIVRGTVQLYRC